MALSRKIFGVVAVVVLLLLAPRPAAAATITFTSSSPASPIVAGQPFSHTFTATGDTTIAFSLPSGALPAGVAFSSAGVLSGTPTLAGSYTFTVRATGSPSGDHADQAVTIVVAAPTITITPPPTEPLSVGIAYSHTFGVSGGTAPHTLSIMSGALPAGMALSSAGVFSGTPATAGTYTFNLKATDALGFSSEVTPVTFRVLAPGGATPTPTPGVPGLPVTGANLSATVGVSVGIIVVGVLLLVLARRRGTGAQ